MKAIVLQRGRLLRRTHDLGALARRLGGEFAAAEFVRLCEALTPWQQAGRYPNHQVDELGPDDLALLDLPRWLPGSLPRVAWARPLPDAVMAMS